MIRVSRLTLASISLLTSISTFLSFQSTASAQAVAVAQVSGTVMDSTGKVVPGAQVTMTETDKHLVRTTTTDAEGGFYTLPNLPVGPYQLVVSAPGFKNYVQSGIVLQVNNNIQINVTMEVGSLSEKVEVSATGSLVETKENSVAHVIDEQRINELPLNGRQATQLIITL